MKNGNYPLVSCVCISQNAENLVRKCVVSFMDQIYPNKELIIIYEDYSKAKKYIESLNDKRIKIQNCTSHPKKSLGELRNISIDISNGEYIIQWDDDDIHHPERIMKQYNSLIKSNASVCMLKRWTIYDTRTRRYNNSIVRKWEGSMIFKKSICSDNNIRYPSKARGEDTDFMLEMLSKSKCIMIDQPYLYQYTTHSNNVWNRRHHLRLCSKLITDNKSIKYFIKLNNSN